MERGRKLCLVSHCVLNCNSKVEGPCRFEGVLKEVIYPLIEKGYGIIQLPCPEATYYGMRRWGHVRDQFDNVYFRNHCKEILKPIIDQIKDYVANDYTLNYVIGINGSPSCGIDISCSSKEWKGEISKQESIDSLKEKLNYEKLPGIFMEELMRLLEDNHIDTTFIGVYESKLEDYDFYKIFE